MSVAPVFIVGMNGSGTTMLADSLGRHPDLYVFPTESKVLPYYIGKLASFGDLSVFANRRRLADEVGRSKPYWQANRKTPIVLDEEELGSCTTFGAVVSSIYQHLARKHGKVRWGEKSPMNIQHVTSLAQHFPDARFIQIVRDGRDAAQSFHRRWGYHPRLAIWRWKRAVLDGRSQGERLGPRRYTEVRYEALTLAPETEMRRVCAFLGLPFHPAVLQSSMRYMDPQHQGAHSGRIVQNSAKWHTYFGPGQVAAMERLSGKVLRDLGYPVEISGDADLTAPERALLRARDRIAFTRAYFRSYGIKAMPMYLRALVASWKQWSASRY